MSAVPSARAVVRWHAETEGVARRDLVIEIPGMRLINPLNGSHGHWSTKAKVRKEQRMLVGLVTAAPLSEYREALAKRYIERVSVTLTRLAPRKFDFDGLVASAKAARDGLADALGLRDDSDPRVEWQYAHEPSKTYGLKIVVTGRTHL